MNRFLHWFNLAGVLALALLCVVQWRLNRQLNLELNAAEKARQQQAARLGEQELAGPLALAGRGQEAFEHGNRRVGLAARERGAEQEKGLLVAARGRMLGDHLP